MITEANSTTDKEYIKDLAEQAGFDAIRFTDPGGLETSAQYLNEFIEKSYHGDMKWLEEKKERRMSPSNLWPEVRSIIMLGMNYGPNHDPLETLKSKDIGNISVYARGKDYHDVIKKKLKQIARQIHRNYDVEVKVFVDTAPVMEKPLAAKSGMGWQGKHTNLVSREFGSWLFLGSIFTTLKLKADNAENDHCGTCQKCFDICPTQAFPSPYELDARRCISYLTIEYKGHIDLQFRKAMGNRIYGCDDCLAICPWNKYATLTRQEALLPRVELLHPDLDELANLDDSSFRKVFSGSPIKRIGRDFFIRNVLIAIGNSNNKKYTPLLVSKLHEDSPHVRAMAVWALKELASKDEFESFRTKYMKLESDVDVLSEW